MDIHVLALNRPHHIKIDIYFAALQLHTQQIGKLKMT